MSQVAPTSWHSGRPRPEPDAGDPAWVIAGSPVAADPSDWHRGQIAVRQANDRAAAVLVPTMAPPVAPSLGRRVDDLDILRSLATSGPGSVDAADLARGLGLTVDQLPVRLGSMVSLGLVQRLDGPKNGRYAIARLGLVVFRQLSDAEAVQLAGG